MRRVTGIVVGGWSRLISTHCFSTSQLLVVIFLLTVQWLLSGCNSSSTEVQTVRSIRAQGSAAQVASPTLTQDVMRVDRQGAVEVAVTPLDFNEGFDEVIRFDVSMNTHSVDLAMDLAKLSILTTDLGSSLPADSWSGGSGHHVRGVLVFPAHKADGSLLMAGASELILTIRDVDAPERVFVWELSEQP